MLCYLSESLALLIFQQCRLKHVLIIVFMMYVAGDFKSYSCGHLTEVSHLYVDIDCFLRIKLSLVYS